MNNLETMLAEKMHQSDIHFDPSGADAEVLRIAHRDLINYLKHYWKIVGKESSDFKVASKIEKMLKDEPAEFEMFLCVWTGMWLKKWAQRVKLVLGDQVQDKSISRLNSTSGDVEASWQKLEGKREIIELIVSSLVKNGELCATEILAENILKAEFARNTSVTDGTKQVLRLLEAALCRSREMAKCVNPLIFVKVDKGYYRTAAVQHLRRRCVKLRLCQVRNLSSVRFYRVFQKC